MIDVMIDALLDKALSPEEDDAAFTASTQSDNVDSLESDQIVAAATSRGVPVIAARQMLEWLDGRSSSLKVNGSPVAFSQMIKGVKYALFQVAPGIYQGTYTPRGARSQR